jgi:16S rRNA (guanine(966)-N(2))-methyltransferase RsmD
VREALFNVLAARLDFAGISVLDLYAGSGALGLEALSRGAARATFVEANPKAAALVARNADALGFAGGTVLSRPVATALAVRGGPVDLVLADPPYETSAEEVNAMLAALAAGGWTAVGTVIAVERRRSSPSLTWPDGWTSWPPRHYGDTRLEIAECC